MTREKQDIIEKDVRSKLFELQDLEYRDFQSKLIPTISKELVIGVRTPALRKLARKYGKTSEAEEFLHMLPHKYFEENNLHGFLIEGMKDYDTCIAALNEFLPYVDNWATCDQMSPKIVKEHLPELLGQIKLWLDSGHPYTIRFGMEMLMRYYLEEEFLPEYLEWVAKVRSEEYYVNMMIAWYFATALAFQYEMALPYIEKKKLDREPHNKAIQKAVESFRITTEHKRYLKTLKIRES